MEVATVHSSQSCVHPVRTRVAPEQPLVVVLVDLLGLDLEDADKVVVGLDAEPVVIVVLLRVWSDGIESVGERAPNPKAKEKSPNGVNSYPQVAVACRDGLEVLDDALVEVRPGRAGGCCCDPRALGGWRRCGCGCRGLGPAVPAMFCCDGLSVG